MVGGPDALLFDLNSSTGGHAFKNLPELGANQSSNQDDIFIIDVQASSPNAVVNQTLTIRLSSNPDLPTDLNSTAPLTIAENQPIGTIVGEFNATDPDANATLTYYLVSGAGDGGNSLFTLDTYGTLRTATTFDYETNASTYSIRVQVRDEYNASGRRELYGDPAGLV